MLVLDEIKAEKFCFSYDACMSYIKPVLRVSVLKFTYAQFIEFARKGVQSGFLKNALAFSFLSWVFEQTDPVKFTSEKEP